jgi:SagB-type dehydrogenase family enzyme
LINSAADYHEMTRYERDGLGGHFLDWANQPDVYKDYPDLKTLSLPREVQPPDVRLSEILHDELPRAFSGALSLEQVSLILLLTQTLTARSRQTGGDFYYRSVPSAGALYPCELYMAVQGKVGLEAGLYHYSIKTHSLSQLRSGDPLPDLSQCMELTGDKNPLLTFFITDIFFRSAWKYRDRAYRYHLLDTGHLLESLTLALRALHLPLSVDYDFDDENVNALLGLDERREVCLAVVRVSTGEPPAARSTGALSEVTHDLSSASRVASREIDYPTIREIHSLTASRVASPVSVAEMRTRLGIRTEQEVEIPRPENWPEVMGYAEAIWQRRSKRNYVHQELSRECLGALLRMLCAGGQANAPAHDARTEAVCIGIMAARTEDFQAGFYLLDPSNATLHLAATGIFVDRMAHICLDQAWLGRAAVHFLFMSNLELLESVWGPRGYRYAMMTAGRQGQQIYLAATAMGFGACGIGAFYDQEAARLIGLNPPSRLLYLVAAGP